MDELDDLLEQVNEMEQVLSGLNISRRSSMVEKEQPSLSQSLDQSQDQESDEEPSKEENENEVDQLIEQAQKLHLEEPQEVEESQEEQEDTVDEKEITNENPGNFDEEYLVDFCLDEDLVAQALQMNESPVRETIENSEKTPEHETNRESVSSLSSVRESLEVANEPEESRKSIEEADEELVDQSEEPRKSMMEEADAETPRESIVEKVDEEETPDLELVEQAIQMAADEEEKENEGVEDDEALESEPELVEQDIQVESDEEDNENEESESEPIEDTERRDSYNEETHSSPKMSIVPYSEAELLIQQAVELQQDEDDEPISPSKTEDEERPMRQSDIEPLQSPETHDSQVNESIDQEHVRSQVSSF